MPFLRLTRDRRGFENTFLMHADRPGERPRLLYWYRTAPGIVQGRAPLDEDAIRTIEEQHPDIEFDWPAILALSEVMTPEDEAPARPPQQQQGKRRRERGRDRGRGPQAAETQAAEGAESTDESAAEGTESAEEFAAESAEPEARFEEPNRTEPLEPVEPMEPVEPVRARSALLESLVGREIATRLRARHAEITARIHEQGGDSALREAWLKRAEPLNPDRWLTADAVLEGVRGADGLFERLRAELIHSRE